MAEETRISRMNITTVKSSSAKAGEQKDADESARFFGEKTADNPTTVEKEKEPVPQVVIRPMAGPARAKKRHGLLIASFFIVVVLPVAAIFWYLETRSVDQYASTVGFTVRQEDDAGGMGAINGLAGLTGATGGNASDSDILYEFIQSQDLVRRIEADLDLWGHYSAPYDQDPVFALKPGGTIESLHAYWGRVMDVDYDNATGLLGLEVRAFTPEFAKQVAEQILVESQTLVNDLNAQSRADILRDAERDVTDSLVRLKAAREALVNFRTRTQIVDPAADMQTRMGVQTSLQQQLAQALIDHDLLAQSAAEGDPRMVQAKRRINVIRERLAEERRTFASDESGDGSDGYPTLIAEYESLAVDREFAEQTYRGALAAKDAALANATRQTRYLASFILPTLPEKAMYPKRLQVVLVAFLFAVLTWALLALVFYSVRDRN